MKAYLMVSIILLLAGIVNGFEYSEGFLGVTNSYIIYGELNCSANAEEINCAFNPRQEYTLKIILENNEYTKDFCFLMTQFGLEPHEVSGLRTENVRGMDVMCIGPKCDPVETGDCFVEFPGKEKKAIRLVGNTGTSKSNFHLRFYYKTDSGEVKKDFDINFNPVPAEDGGKDETSTEDETGYSAGSSTLISEIALFVKENPKAIVISLGILILAMFGIRHYMKEY